jgi:lipocalin
MSIFSQNLVRSEELEQKIKMACSFNNSKYEFIEGQILNVENTNVSLIEPHRIIIKCKGKRIFLLYFDKDSLFLYSRRIPITMKQLDEILKAMKTGVL